MDPLKDISDADLEKQITDDVIKNATGTTNAEATADQKQDKTDKQTPKKDEAPATEQNQKKDGDVETKDKEITAKKEVPKSIETLLAKKNEEKRLKEQYK